MKNIRKISQAKALLEAYKIAKINLKSATKLKDIIAFRVKMKGIFQRFRNLARSAKMSLAVFVAFIGISQASTFTSFRARYTEESNTFDNVQISQYSRPELVDIDGDGDLDLFIGEYDEIKYYQNTGSTITGIFSLRENGENPLDFNILGINGDAYYNQVRFIDLDNDGDYDVVLGSYDKNTSASFSYFENTSSNSLATFTRRTGNDNPLGFINYLGRHHGFDFGDIDGDGDYDFVVNDGGNLEYYENVGSSESSSFEVGDNNDFSQTSLTGYDYPTLLLEDLDGDGDLDLFGSPDDDSHLKTQFVRLYENVGTSNSFSFIDENNIFGENPFRGIPLGDYGYYYAGIAFGDIDNDGDLDAISSIYAPSSGNDGMLYIENIGSVQSSSINFTGKSGNNNPIDGFRLGNYTLSLRPEMVDIDNDGDLDLFVGEYYGDILFFENLGNSRLPFFKQRTGGDNPFNGVNNGYYSSLEFVDIDNDGDLDAFISEENWDNTNPADGVHFYENIGDNSSPNFTERTGGSNPFDQIEPFDDDFITSFSDIDNDGDLDVFIGSNNYFYLEFYRNTNNNTSATLSKENLKNPNDILRWGGYNSYLIGSNQWGGMDLADLDNDGDKDLFVSFYDNGDGASMTYFMNVGSASDPHFVIKAGEINPLNGLSFEDTNFDPDFGDLDGDGDLDLFIGYDYSYGFGFFENNENTPSVGLYLATDDEATVLSNSATFDYAVKDDGTNVDIEIEYGTATGVYSSTSSATVISSTGVAEFNSYVLEGLNGSTSYFARIWATSSNTFEVSSEIAFVTLSAEPDTHATSFTVDNQGIDNISVQFTAAEDIGADGYIILYKQAGSFTGAPVDEGDYSVGDGIGDAFIGAIVTDDEEIKATISGLTKNLTYTFKIYPFNWDGSNITSADYKVDGDVPSLTTQTIPTLGEIAMGSFIVLFAVGDVWYLRRQS